MESNTRLTPGKAWARPGLSALNRWPSEVFGAVWTPAGAKGKACDDTRKARLVASRSATRQKSSILEELVVTKIFGPAPERTNLIVLGSL